MEATGVYWIPLFEILEARGFTVLLVNARHVKNVPGRKGDVSDCEWSRDLLTVGLLRGSFRPADSSCGSPGLSAAPRNPDPERREPRPADAKSARPDESATSARRQRHHWRHWPPDPARHCCRAERPAASDAHHLTQVLRRLRQGATHLGFGLINLSTGEVIDGAVSCSTRSGASCRGHFPVTAAIAPPVRPHVFRRCDARDTARLI